MGAAAVARCSPFEAGQEAQAIEAGVLEGGDIDVADVAIVDAGSEAAPCLPNGAAVPVGAFDPLDGVSDANPPCGVARVFVTDDSGTGLDLFSYGKWSFLGDASVASCIGVTFGAPLKEMRVRVRAVGNACGRACLPDACGKGRAAYPFVGSNPQQLRPVQELPLTDSFTDFFLPLLRDDRVGVVCRGSWSADDDDIEVDSITATCRP
jgi:hypothetical protein